MRKLKSIMMALVAVIAGAGLLASCSGNSEDARVAKKIESGEQLTQSEYTTVIEYLGKYAEKVQPIQDNINNLSATDPKAEEYQKQLSQEKDAHKYLELFGKALDEANQSDLGADNVALVDKYAGYEWFDAPDWASITTDPAAAGIELQAPSSDTTGVIAGAVDELKIKEGR